MNGIERKDFSSPDETRLFVDKGRVEVLELGDSIVGRGYFEPGWRWSSHVKPLANTESCQAAHTCYVLRGRMHIAMNDGTGIDLGPGDVAIIPPGHDAWTLGDETCELLDFTGLEHYAEAQARPRATESTEAQPPM